MNTRLFIGFLLLLLSSSGFAQIGLMSSGAVSTPAGSEKLLAQRHKALRAVGTSNDKEVYVGVHDLGTTTNRAEGDLSYTNIIHFKLEYSASANTLTSTTDINGVHFVTALQNVSAIVTAAGKTIPLSEMNFMELQIRTQNATSAVDVTNLILNGQSITGPYTRANSPGTSYWHLMNYDFGSGFTLTGTITLTGSFGSMAEANKVEFTFGSQPANASPLPVSWGDISVRKNAFGNNEVKWTTLQETKSESFLIQRSENGRNFQAVARVAASGTTGATTQYTFEDRQYRKDAYYRIIVVDVDGKAAYSKIISIKGKATSSVLYNGSNKLIVQSTDNSSKGIKVFDANGRVLICTIIKEANASLDVGSLSPGIYFVQMKGVEGAALRFYKQ